MSMTVTAVPLGIKAVIDPPKSIDTLEVGLYTTSDKELNPDIMLYDRYNRPLALVPELGLFTLGGRNKASWVAEFVDVVSDISINIMPEITKVELFMNGDMVCEIDVEHQMVVAFDRRG